MLILQPNSKNHLNSNYPNCFKGAHKIITTLKGEKNRKSKSKSIEKSKSKHKKSKSNK